MNPPYTNNIDLKFFPVAINVSDRIVAVHTAISTITRKQTKRYVEHKKLIDGHVKSIKLFNGNPVFGIELFYPCQIVDIDMSKTFPEVTVDYHKTGTQVFRSIFDVTKWGNIPEYYSLEKKILDWCNANDNCEDHLTSDTSGSWFINIPQIVTGKLCESDAYADMYGPSQYAFFGKSNLVSTSHMGGYYKAFQFGRRTEADNMFTYLQTDFARFSLSVLKCNCNLHSGELRGVPYLPSYSEDWTDIKLNEFFGITEAEQAFIKKVIPKYYT